MVLAPLNLDVEKIKYEKIIEVYKELLRVHDWTHYQEETVKDLKQGIELTIELLSESPKFQEGEPLIGLEMLLSIKKDIQNRIKRDGGSLYINAKILLNELKIYQDDYGEIIDIEKSERMLDIQLFCEYVIKEFEKYKWSNNTEK